MKKNYSAILFDLDGTLTDSSPGILGCVRYALDKMGRKIPEETLLKGFLGPPLADSLTKYCGMTLEEAEKAAWIYRIAYDDKCLTENSLFDGIYELLEQLKAAGKLLGVATTKPLVTADRILEHFGIKKFFDAVCGAAPDGSGGEKAGIIRNAMKELGVSDKGQVLMIGDRLYDINGAKTVGIDSAGVLFGYSSPGELEEAGADYLFGSPQEIAEFILS